MHSVLQVFKKHENRSSEPAFQIRINKRIAKKLRHWVAEKRFCNPECSLADVAEEFEVTPDALSYYFSTVIRLRFTTFRKHHRLEEAKRIIYDEPGCKLLLVASRVGITDKCNFRKQFHERYGFGPRAWQIRCEQMRNSD